jgi:hypothetical protein
VDLVVFALRGDKASFQAARVRAAIGRWTDEWYGAPFVGEAYAENIRIIRKYDELYARSFWKDLEEATRSPIGLHLVQRLIRNGTLDRAEILRDSIRGFGAYSKGVIDALAGLSPGQVRLLEVEYKKLSPKPFCPAH